MVALSQKMYFCHRHLYIPDPYFLRQISYTTQNSMFLDETFSLLNSGTRDKPDLVFTFKTRLMLELSCDMEYSRFPFDTQTCPVLLVSMRELGTNKMSVKWKTLHVKWIKSQIREVVLNFDQAIFNSTHMNFFHTKNIILKS